jgi:hypothetical protein
MKQRSWNSEWLEVGLSWNEALVLRELLSFCDDLKMGPPSIPWEDVPGMPGAGSIIGALRRGLCRVVRVRIP